MNYVNNANNSRMEALILLNCVSLNNDMINHFKTALHSQDFNVHTLSNSSMGSSSDANSLASNGS